MSNYKRTFIPYFKHFSLLLILCNLTINALAQNYYHNGGLSTGNLTSNGSTTAASGYTWSELQSVSGITNNNLGFGAIYNNAVTTDLRIADDFTIPIGQQLQISRIDFYCYQTSYAATTPPVDALRIEIWNGDPSLPTSTKIAGDMVTNRYNPSNSGDAKMYRIGNNNPNTTRKIWRISGDITINLNAGTYWVVFQVHATNDGSIFFPAVTKVGAITVTGANAKQYSGTAWSKIVDAGSNQDMDFPFTINYHNYAATLPVSFADFQVKKQSDVAKLTWQTYSEEHNKEFIISRSANGNDFTEITRQKGAGNSKTTQQYAYIDTKPISGTSYYKLEQVDFDGQRTTLKIAPFQFNLNLSVKVSTFPNPSKGIINLLTNISAAELTLTITNIQGIKVHQENIRLANDVKEYPLQLKNKLQPGIYTITIKATDGSVYTLKQIIV
jgi:Secretion system C-terminal sorting domain